MLACEKELKEVQEFAFDIIKKYPIDKTAPRVLMSLAEVSPIELNQFFELNKETGASGKYYRLADSGSIKKCIEDYAYLASIGL